MLPALSRLTNASTSTLLILIKWLLGSRNCCTGAKDYAIEMKNPLILKLPKGISILIEIHIETDHSTECDGQTNRIIINSDTYSIP